VTTNGFSDWSLQDLPWSELALRLRLTYTSGDVVAEFAPSGSDQWKVMRVAHLHLPAGAPIWCGLYACSPKGAGFRAEFHLLRVETAKSRPN